FLDESAGREHGDHDVGARSYRLGRVGSANAGVRIDELLNGCSIDVMDRNSIACASEVTCHGSAHYADPDKPDSWFTHHSYRSLASRVAFQTIERRDVFIAMALVHELLVVSHRLLDQGNLRVRLLRSH